MSKLDRIQWAILLAALLFGAAGALWQGIPYGLGTFAGGVVGYLNFRWLRRTVERMLGEGKGKGLVAVAYTVKLVVLGLVLWALMHLAHVPSLALLIGVGAMPVGIVLETVFETVGI